MDINTVSEQEKIINQKIDGAISLHQQFNYAEARKLYLEVLQLDQKNDLANYLIGLLEFETGNHKLAQELLLKAAKFNPCYDYCKDAAKVCFFNNDTKNALENLEKALAIQPNCKECKDLLEKLKNSDAIKDQIYLTDFHPSSKNLPDVDYIEFYSAGVMERKRPQAIEYFSDLEIEKWTPYLKDYFKPEYDAGFLVKINNGRAFCIQSSETYILTGDNRFLEDLLLRPEAKLYREISAPLPEPKYLGENVAVLSSLWGNNFYFWTNIIPCRIFLLQKAGYKLSDFDKIIMNFANFPYQKNVIKMLNIPEDKIVAPELKGELYRAKNLVVPSIPRNHPRWSTNAIRNLMLNSDIKSNKSKRIYISRNKAKTRKILNEERLFNDFLVEYGFQFIYSEQMSFQDQLAMFENAEAIITPHGAGLANLVFCKPGTKVIEIFNPYWLNIGYLRIADNCDLDYHYMFGVPDSKNNLDMTVDINKLKINMEIAGII